MRLRPISAKRLLSLLAKAGYSQIRQKGSHVVLLNPAGRLIVVPLHSREIGTGLLREIIRELGMTREEFLRMLERM